MHPDLLRALAKARHEDLLNTHPSRGQPAARTSGQLPLIPASRRRLGSLLIRTGARIMGEGRTPLELAPE